VGNGNHSIKLELAYTVKERPKQLVNLMTLVEKFSRKRKLVTF